MISGVKVQVLERAIAEQEAGAAMARGEHLEREGKFAASYRERLRQTAVENEKKR